MERVGILIVSYGSRGAALLDTFRRSREYDVDLYIADKQKNPYNVKRAKQHVVIPSLNNDEICSFAKKYSEKISFGIVGPEKPIINGIRNLIEKETGIPMICSTREYAIEGSKVAQRKLFNEITPKVNPRFKIFDKKDYKTLEDVKKQLFRWLDELEDQVAIKPDTPVAGKGVGVWGDHFSNRKQLFEHFVSNLRFGSVIVEEKIEGEESSFQAFCDGKHLVPLPDTRDYKRAFDGDFGPNTGGMGSYKDKEDILPFISQSDYDEEKQIVTKIFEKLRGDNFNSALRGIPFYVAFMHTRNGPMVLEVNSRPGDPEIINILPILKEDFVEVCFRIIDGSLKKVDIDNKATVVMYKVPPNYGEYSNVFLEKVNKNEIGTPIKVDKTNLSKLNNGDQIRFYPGSMEMRSDGKNYSLGSRAICTVGIGNDLNIARKIALEGLFVIRGGALWNRRDIASPEHIALSVRHMKQLRK